MPALEVPQVERVAWTIPAGVSAIIANCGTPIEEKFDKAYYSQRTKKVTMPPMHSFVGSTDEIKAANHSAVLLHELCHAAEDRLGLMKAGKFGDYEYSAGELRVELASTMICRHYNLPTNTSNQMSYAANWARDLRADKNALSRAMSEATQIFEHMMQFDPDYVPAHERNAAPSLASSLDRKTIANEMLLVQ